MIGIIDTNAGNQLSVKNAIRRMGVTCIISDDIEILRSCDKIILPGVGEAKNTMDYIRAKNLDKFIISYRKPFLGICLGMQIMSEYSEEGNTPCLGIFKTQAKLFPDNEIVPHMGWNNLSDLTGTLFQSIEEKDDFYFVHSFYIPQNEYSIARCNYILPFCAAMNKDNFYATQFHPEKSAKTGAKLLKNFLSL